MQAGWLMRGIVALMLASFPAVAYAAGTGDYRYCRATSAGGAKPWSLVRTLRRDGRFVFQSGVGEALLPSHDPNFRAYLAWPKAPSDEPRLWIVQYHHPRSNDSLVVSGGTSDPHELVVTGRDLNELEMFDLDPQALVARYPDAHRVRFALYRSSTMTHRALPSSIDLDALRAQLAQTGALAAAIGSDDCADHADLPAEADAAQYIICDSTLHDWSGDYSAETGWIFRLSRTLDLGATADGIAFAPPQPGGSGGTAGSIRAFRFSGAAGYENREHVVMEFSAGERRYAVPLRQAWQLDWPRLLELDRAGTPIGVAIRDAKGKLLDGGTMHAGIFSAVQSRLLQLAAERARKLENPMTECLPNGGVDYALVIA